MKLINCNRRHIEQRLRERGVQWKDILPAIVESSGDDYVVDVEHPAYPRKIVAVPMGQWPLWAKAIQKIRSDEDKGVGDTVHRRLGKMGAAFKIFMKSIRAPCGCDRRREEWNQKYPY